MWIIIGPQRLERSPSVKQSDSEKQGNLADEHGVYIKVVNRGAIGVAVMTLAVIGAAVWSGRYLAPPALSPSELNLHRPNPKPPSAPAARQEDYSQARRKPCKAAEPVIATTICEVLRTPEVFADKCIRVPARFLTDGIEYSVLVDESCRKMGLDPWATAKETEKLDEAIVQPGKGPGTFDRRVTARFTGRFVWRPNARRDARVLEINAVSDLKIQELPER